MGVILRLRHSLRALAVGGLVLLTGAGALPAVAASDAARGERPSADGLSAVIRYTEYGVPHILADDYADLGFGDGWAQAADAVCTLADGFVTVRGERARYFGPDAAPDRSFSEASTNLSSDLFFRGVRDARTVEKLLDRPAPEGPSRQAKELMRGWAAGYNAWLRQHKVTDPACRGKGWVRPVTATDVARRGYALTVLGGQGALADAITEARPPAARTVGGGKAVADPAAAARAYFAARHDTGMGSNAVAFSGAATANRRGLLLGNPHYPWHGNRRFWQSQQTIPGELNVSGASLLGSPTVQIGHNASMAWSHTVATGVPMNLYELKPAPGDPRSYLVDGRPERMTERKVTVAVRGADGRLANVTRSQWWTRYGPVVTGLGDDLPLPWTPGSAYALADPNAAQFRFFDSSLGLSKARDVRGVREALRRTQGLPWVNTVAADSAGHSLYTQSQVLPRVTDEVQRSCATALGRRTYPESGLAVLDGSRGACALGRDRDALQPGVFGPSAMPTLVDAPYAENSNDSAWLANADRPLTGYPRIFGDIGTERSFRTRGGVEDVAAMAKRGRLTVADLERQQFAGRAPTGDLAAADAAAACAKLPGGRATGPDGRPVDVSGACGVLARWDRRLTTGSRGALLFDRFVRALVREVPADRLWRVPFDPAKPVTTPNTLNTAEPGVARALAAAVHDLRSAGIALDAPLGEHQFVVRKGKRIPVPGGTEALGAWNKVESRWDGSRGGYPEVSMGTSYVQAVGFDGGPCPVTARTLLTYSQSDDPASAHSSDQTELFSKGRMTRGRFCERDILASPGLRVVRVAQR
ncbi:penicillin acylase family protein [Streptomyces mobaraensis NBRC 13819 = DSM 40847]|uniref:Capsaicin-hydrolysis protein n=1 Tax=Streptomyces mobaraensis TaxID=35621 RepID=Q0R3W5_STRMB|nr:capsaicin-hydrolysis protein precursor [Streptomyces mobaraensis]QTT72560.1 penicillin acylase family protein [Streptomyces mobaraensis NBRC 13819 = DSM 40847]BAF51977.1 penicillin V acylase [Streptomyces mobaraensis]